MSRLFGFDPGSGERELFHADGDKFTIQTQADVEPILEANKRERNSGHDGFSPSREMKKLASVPNAVIALWKERYGVDVFNRDHTQAVRRLLDDPEWAYLRTSPGNVGCRTRHL